MTPAAPRSFLEVCDCAHEAPHVVSRWDARIDLIPTDVAAASNHDQPEYAPGPCSAVFGPGARLRQR